MNTLSLIIKDLAESSIQADSIVKRLVSMSAVKDLSLNTVESLQKDLVSLQEENTRLQTLIKALQQEQDEILISEEDKEAFMSSMKDSLTKMDLSQMKFGYSTGAMRVYPSEIRYLVALALVNTCTQRSLQPDPIWLSIVAKCGGI